MSASPRERELVEVGPPGPHSRWLRWNRRQPSLGHFILDLALQYSVIIALVVLTVVAQILYPGFLTVSNIWNILSQNAELALVALGVTYCLIAGVFDLSIGSIVGLSSLVAAAESPHGFVVAFVAAVVAGLAAGLINAFVVTKLNVNAFIATLGTQTVFLGIATIYSTSTIFATNTGFLNIGTEKALGIPATVVIVGVVFIIAAFVLHKTVYGRVLYILGGNAEAARLAGLRVKAARGSVFLVSGVCAAVAGVLLATVVGNGQATYGAEYTLDAYAMVVVGGTSLFGGEGAVWRTVAGVLIIAMTQNLFESLALPGSAQDLVIGGVLILAVALDAFARARRT